jgi:Tfp pilus assembly protein PilX
MRSARLGLLMTALAVLVVLATLGVSATDNSGAETRRGTSRCHSLVIDNQVPVRTMQSLCFTVTVLVLNNAVHP